MSEGKYNVGKQPIRKETFLAAQRFAAFCRQFEKMNEREKKVCIERTDNLAPRLLYSLYDVLNEYME